MNDGNMGWNKFLKPGSYDVDRFNSLGIQDNDLSGIMLAPKTKILLYKNPGFANNQVDDVVELENASPDQFKHICLAVNDLQFNDAISSIRISNI